MGLVGVRLRASPPPSALRCVACSDRLLSSSSERVSLFRRRAVSLRPPGPIAACRLGSFTAQCSVTHSEIVITETPAADVAMETSPTIPSNCSMPFVHLSSEILNSELHLLTEETYSTGLLTTLPVLSEEEQEALAATPAHPAGFLGVHNSSPVYGYGISNVRTIPPRLQLHNQTLYASCFAGNLSEHLWNFTWPAAVAMLHPSLLPVAVVSFFTKFLILSGGPSIGTLMDSLPRIPSYYCLTLVQTASQLVSAAMIIYALSTVRPPSLSSLLLQPWFLVMVGAIATESLASLTLGVTMERDWIVLLAGANRPLALARANAMSSRIDLLCEMAGASLFGFLLSKNEPSTCIKLACALSVCILPLMIILGHLIDINSSGVFDRSLFPQSCKKQLKASPPLTMKRLVETGLTAIRNGWMEYKDQPVLPASLAYVLLCFNIALSPGAMMTTFLVHHGIAASVIGAFGGLSAFMGVVATFLSANLVRKVGILKVGAAGLMLQSLLLILAVAVYWSGSISMPGPLFFFLSLIVLSRLGHMSYSIASIQILHKGIPAAKANLVGITEMSIASLAELLILGIAIVANNVEHFGFLALLSLSSVVASTWMFCQWLANPTDEQRSLFTIF